MPTHGIPGTSRAPDGGSAAVVELKRPVDLEMLAQLHELVSAVERGEVLGIVALIHAAGGEYDCRSLGDGYMGPMMVAFETWKFRQLAARELACAVCGNGVDPHG